MALIGTLTDDFTTKDVSKWTWGGTASVVSGQANFVPVTTYANSIASAATYTLTGSSAVVRVVQTSPTGTTGTLENWFEIDSGAGGPPMVMWRKLGANLIAAWRNASSVETALATLTYSSTTHAWWRIRESGGTTFWDTSTDGIAWTNRASVANPFTYTTTLAANLGAGYSGTEATPGTFIVDNFNLPPTSITLTETGTGTGAMTVAAVVPLAGTGTGTDALTGSATYAWVGANPWIGSDPWPGPDSASNALPDTGTGTDALTVKAIVPLTEAGAGTTALLAGVPVTLTDSGALADVLAASAAVPVTETAIGTDTLAVSAVALLTQTGAFTDAIAAGVPITLTGETGALTDALAVTLRSIGLAETGALTDGFFAIGPPVIAVGTVTLASANDSEVVLASANATSVTVASADNGLVLLASSGAGVITVTGAADAEVVLATSGVGQVIVQT